MADEDERGFLFLVRGFVRPRLRVSSCLDEGESPPLERGVVVRRLTRNR